MLIAGFQKMTLLDYPDKLAALIFTQGCNFACGYCHNPEMIPKLRVLDNSPDLEVDNILDFLSTRIGLLDGVVVSGGEPTVHDDLGEFLQGIKDMGFLIKLDSNGSHPEVLRTLFDQQLIDYIAMDIKHTPKKYKNLVKNNCHDRIAESIHLIKNSGVDYEFRSTILPYCHSIKDIESMGEMIRGAKVWHLQNFRSLKTLRKDFQQERSFTSKELDTMKALAGKYAKLITVR